ncbi:MAG TPA: hypothetical protein VGM54_12880 [Chthoniobacter sp.]|jgi:hypothetical protein
MRTTLAIVILFLVVFCVMILIALNCEPRMPGATIVSTAFDWTLRLLGGLIAVAAAIGMLLVGAGHGSFQRQIVLVPPLLAGVLLLSANWGAALGLGVVVAVWIYRCGGPEIERPETSPISNTPK